MHIMDFRVNTPKDVFNKITEFSSDLMSLNNPEKIRQTIPAEAVFAVAVQIVERQLNESFVATTLTPNLAEATMQTSADQGFDGRFFGYLVIIPGYIELFKQNELYLEEQLTNITVSPDQGEYVIYLPNKKFKLSQIIPLVSPDGHFESKVSGVQGATPLLSQLESQGATVKRISSAQTVIGIAIFVLLFVGIAILALLKK
jgi:hypothetical protein